LLIERWILRGELKINKWRKGGGYYVYGTCQEWVSHDIPETK
jgi:hypothetical protein